MISPKDIVARAQSMLQKKLDLVKVTQEHFREFAVPSPNPQMLVKLRNGETGIIDKMAGADLRFSSPDLEIPFEEFAEEVISPAVDSIYRMLMSYDGILVTQELELPGNMLWSEVAPSDGGICVRLLRGYNIATNKWMCFIDVLFGFHRSAKVSLPILGIESSNCKYIPELGITTGVR